MIIEFSFLGELNQNCFSNNIFLNFCLILRQSWNGFRRLRTQHMSHVDYFYSAFIVFLSFQRLAV